MRGWRERHHRQHVRGDYRHPPKKGSFEKIQKRSKQLMQRDPVRLQRELREIALRGIVECLAGDGIAVLVACLDARICTCWRNSKICVRANGWDGRSSLRPSKSNNI